MPGFEKGKAIARFPFLRRPLKLILCVLLMALTTAAALVFSLQYYLDGLVMDHSMDSTAYVGTVYSRLQESPLLQKVPEEILQQLEASEAVESMMVSRVYSARAEGLRRTADGFGINESLDMKLFLEGIIEGEAALSSGMFGVYEAYTLNILKNWGGSWPGEGIPVWVLRDRDVETPLFRPGDHVFLVGRYNSNANGDVNGMILTDPASLRSMGEETDSAIWNQAVYVLPEALGEEEAQELIMEYMRQTGLAASWETANTLYDVFNVYEVEDMSMVLTVADETTFITEGRELRRSDFGRKVCVINEAAARENGLTVGDKLRLSVTDGCYTCDSDIADGIYRGWDSGYPFEGDALLEYRDHGEFEIVGIYSEIDRRVGSMDFLHHTRNDIFVPAGILPSYDTDVRARALTFRILGPDHERFMDEFEVPLNEQGYTMSIVDTGWESVSGSFYAMSDRRLLMLACALAAYFAAVISFDVLLAGQFRHEFALRRLLGAYPKEAGGIYVSGFLFTAIPAGLLAVAGSYGAYCLWLQGQTAAALPVELPAHGQIMALLAGWVGLELLAALAVLLGMAFGIHRRSLLKLLR